MESSSKFTGEEAVMLIFDSLKFLLNSSAFNEYMLNSSPLIFSSFVSERDKSCKFGVAWLKRTFFRGIDPIFKISSFGKYNTDGSIESMDNYSIVSISRDSSPLVKSTLCK